MKLSIFKFGLELSLCELLLSIWTKEKVSSLLSLKLCFLEIDFELYEKELSIVELE